jgi:hypothetical protein
VSSSGSSGELTPIVETVGAMLSASVAISLGFRRRANFEPSEEDLPKLANRLASALVAIALAVLWSQYANTAHTTLLLMVTVYSSVIAVVASIVYSILMGTLTVSTTISQGPRKGRAEKRVKGLWKTKGASVRLEELEKSGKYPTDQEFLEGNHYDLDRVWSPSSRALAKQCVALPFVILNISIAGALSCGAMLLLLKNQTHSP